MHGTVRSRDRELRGSAQRIVRCMLRLMRSIRSEPNQQAAPVPAAMTGPSAASVTAELIADFERMRELTAQVHAPEFLSLDVTMQQAKALHLIQRHARASGCRRWPPAWVSACPPSAATSTGSPRWTSSPVTTTPPTGARSWSP